jgi:exonuclease SbcC
MKITLKNFRCYEDKTFDFGENGIVLISGKSGAGKSTILNALYFVLFGIGTKIVMYGKTSCNVTLEFDGMTIVRSKRPNRLVVNEIYEDEEAQGIINKKFGETFNTTGYISQNAKDSFILMSPIEKLGFLEKFAFQDIDLPQIKKRCKDLIKERNESLIKVTSQLEMASLMVKELGKPEEVCFPLKCSKKNRDKAIKNEIIRYKNVQILIKRCKKRISSLEKELNSLRVYEVKITTKEKSINGIVQKIGKLTLEKESINYKGDIEVKKCEKDLMMFISQRELVSLKNRYEEDQKRLQIMKKEEIDKLSEKIKDMKFNIWKEYNKDEIDELIIDYKHIIKDLEKLYEEKSNLGRYRVDEDLLEKQKQELEYTKKILYDKNKVLDKLKFQQEVFSCPSCDIKLRFENDELFVVENSISTDINEQQDIETISIDISKLKDKILGLENIIRIESNKLERYKEIKNNVNKIEEQYEEIPDMKDIKDNLEYVIDYTVKQQELEKNIKKLEDKLNKNIYSSSIVLFEESLEKQQNEIEYHSKKVGKNILSNDIDEEQLRENITTQKNNKEKIYMIESNINNLEKEKLEFEKQIDICKQNHLKVYESVREIDLVDSELNNSLSELNKLKDKKNVHEKNVKDIDKYKEYKKSYDTYMSWINKVNVLEKQEIEYRKQYGAAILLKEKILESESIAMLNIISSINAHTHIYLESFFPDNPISVKLVPFKESKQGKVIKKKPQINLEIEYKGMEAELNMLSGGELSRVILAFALALAEMFNTPMIMLDECTSSLDQELTGDVMDGIKENFNGKIVLIIAHQIIEGGFSKVIKVG